VRNFLCFVGRCWVVASLAAAVAFGGPVVASGHEPLRLHHDNPHYFLFRGKPAVLIASGEHYGAVLNCDFDYVPYLDELARHGLNLTRTFAGAYREIGSSFGIVDNTLAPKLDRFVCPWARTDVPGPAENGAKFDLSKWDPAFFARLKDFVAQTGKRGVVVELSLFSAIYDDALWAANPMNPANNVNELGALNRLQVFNLRDARLTELQAGLVRKIAAELEGADNVYFEICNEPYFGDVTPQWSERMIGALVEAEKSLPARHLIAQNIANGSVQVKEPNKNVSILNFHYSTPPDSVQQNYALGRAIGDDETGFRGSSDLAYRSEGWEFLLAGGAVYDNLDYSFTPAHPDGSQAVTTSPGGGGANLRRQLGVLARFLAGFELVNMHPDNSVVRGGVPDKGSTRVLVEPGKQYAIYVRGGEQTTLRVELPTGAYRAEWIDTKSGEIAGQEAFDHATGERSLESPRYADDIALRIVVR
jgi:hypothetical protein